MAKGKARKIGKSDVDARLARHGGLTYLEIPAVDVRKSAKFYERVFGWEIERDGAGGFKFSDAKGLLIGRWKTGRAVSRRLGMLVYFYVDRIDVAIKRVGASGGRIVKGPFVDGNLTIAVVGDPAGNLIGVWQDNAR